MLENVHHDNVVVFRNRVTVGAANRFKNLFIRPIEHLLSLDRCRTLYEALPESDAPQQFLDSILNALDITVNSSGIGTLTDISTGPLVVVANHPFGAVEGIVLMRYLLSVRKDVKVMANFMLNRIPQMKSLLIPVDPFSSGKTAQAHIRSIRYAHRWVKEGGVLLVFPSGTVSHFQFSRREISDPLWNPVVGSIIHKTNAPVLPVFFGGANGPLFQLLGMVHPRLRTALLARELLNKRGRRMDMRIGRLLPYSRLKKFETGKRLTAYLRWRTYLLGITDGKDVPLQHKEKENHSVVKRPVADALDPGICQIEIDQLPIGQQLLKSGDNAVWIAYADQIPRLLLEIARLRELSFRDVGEGTGQIMDMDAFDSHYLHIFVWNEAKREIIGAYRLGMTDRILKTLGPSGFYTSTLFDSQRDFYQRIGPAIELGRSFVRPEYQKSFAPLLLLWKGIGHYIAAHPTYRILYGPVSISRDYTDLSRSLIATSLLQHHPAPDVAGMVRPKSSIPLKHIHFRGGETGWETEFCRDLEEINWVVKDIEGDEKGIPVLLKHYLKLGGRLIAFSEDRNFNEALDGLIIVDLCRTDRKTLERYMGSNGAATFLNYHAFPDQDMRQAETMLLTA